MNDFAMFILGLKDVENGLTTMAESMEKKDVLYSSFIMMETAFRRFYKNYQRMLPIGG